MKEDLLEQAKKETDIILEIMQRNIRSLRLQPFPSQEEIRKVDLENDKLYERIKQINKQLLEKLSK